MLVKKKEPMKNRFLLKKSKECINKKVITESDIPKFKTAIADAKTMASDIDLVRAEKILEKAKRILKRGQKQP